MITLAPPHIQLRGHMSHLSHQYSLHTYSDQAYDPTKPTFNIRLRHSASHYGWVRDSVYCTSVIDYSNYVHFDSLDIRPCAACDVPDQYPISIRYSVSIVGPRYRYSARINGYPISISAARHPWRRAAWYVVGLSSGLLTCRHDSETIW